MLIVKDESIPTVVGATGCNHFHGASTNDLCEASPRACCANDIREMLSGLAQLDFTLEQASPLQKVCKAGSEYGLRVLERKISPELFSLMRSKAKRHIKDDLRRILARVTRPSFTLQLNAFHFAYEAIHPQKVFSTPKLIENKFLGRRPYDRLISLFKEFPVLAELWSQLIHQWSDSVSELLARVEKDEQELSRVFFRGQPVGKIIDLRPGLSDPHNKGRTVVRVRFQAGSVIYKPRCGHGEEDWFSLIGYLNTALLRPKLRAARVTCRDGYCWMEEVEFSPCKDQAAVRRFYKRFGAVIAAAYLLRAVDCHRDNVIARGEYPVLVDAEALCHIGRKEKTRDRLDALYGTGFLPNPDRRSSYQYLSSALGKMPPGKHTPHIESEPFYAAGYEGEILDGCRRVWRCLLGTKARRAAFGRHLQRFRGRKRRQIYSSTREYNVIMRASTQPPALRDGVARDILIASSCARSAVSQAVIREEISSLKRLDIPYFTRRSTVLLPLPRESAVPPQIVEGFRRAIQLKVSLSIP